MKVQISKKLLKELLDDIETRAKIVHGGYDFRTKTYPWNDAIWKKASPHQFRMIARARKALVVPNSNPDVRT